MKRRKWMMAFSLFFAAGQIIAQDEPIKYGTFDTWVVRHIKESRIIGGDTKTLYEVGPDAVWDNNDEYTNQGGSPWATSNVMARVCGVTKTNTSVYREPRGDGYCARLETHEERVKVMGLVNIEVLAAGAILLGEMPEPITSTSNPMSKMIAGIPFTKRPKALVFDYKVKLVDSPDRIRQTGFSRISKVEGPDMPDVFLMLQKRWEDEKGNVYAKRVGTLVHRFTKNTPEWVNDAAFEIHYGDITKESFYRPYMGLVNGDDVKYTRNSKGKSVKIQEIGWADADEKPTHLILQFDSSYGGAYVGTIGTTFWLDNVRLRY